MNDWLVSGIYCINNEVNNHIYIGSSRNLQIRKRGHKSTLKRGISGHTILQAAVNEFGIKNFKFKILLICDPNMLLYYEQACIDKFKPEYNAEPTAESSRGIKRSKDFIRRMSVSLMGNTNAKARKGRHYPKISEALKGMPHSEETKKKMSISAKAAWAVRKASTK